MKYNLHKVRTEIYKMSIRKFASYCGIGSLYYKRYEDEGEIPSKYVYTLWKKLPNFPLPRDFFYFTSIALTANMKYHGMTQTEIAEMFNIRTQATISKYMTERIPMYEFKETFLKFNPFITTIEYRRVDGNDFRLIPLVNLSAKGMLTESYMETAKKRGKKKKAHDDLKRLRKAQEEAENKTEEQ